MIARAASAFEDLARRARIMRRLWIVSTLFTLFGFAVMLYLAFVRR